MQPCYRFTSAATCCRLEILNTAPDLVEKFVCAWARLPLPHQGPFLIHYLLDIGSSELLNRISPRFGKRVGKLVNLCYVGRFAGHGFLGVDVLIQHQVSRKPYYHSESDVKRTVDYAERVVV